MTGDTNDRESDEAQQRHHGAAYEVDRDEGPERDLGSPGDRPANVHETVDPPGTQEVPADGDVYPSPGGLGNPGDDRSGPSAQEHD